MLHTLRAASAPEHNDAVTEFQLSGCALCLCRLEEARHVNVTYQFLGAIIIRHVNHSDKPFFSPRPSSHTRFCKCGRAAARCLSSCRAPGVSFGFPPPAYRYFGWSERKILETDGGWNPFRLERARVDAGEHWVL